MVADSFADSDWSARYAKLGDEAEQVFREVYDGKFIDWGIRRPPFKMDKLSLRKRTEPDFLAREEQIEAMGVGRPQVLKLKIEKWLGLSLHAIEMPLRLFIWDSYKKRYGYITFEELTQVIVRCKKLGHFPEGKTYYELPIAEMDIEWTPKR